MMDTTPSPIELHTGAAAERAHLEDELARLRAENVVLRRSVQIWIKTSIRLGRPA